MEAIMFRKSEEVEDETVGEDLVRKMRSSLNEKQSEESFSLGVGAGTEAAAVTKSSNGHSENDVQLHDTFPHKEVAVPAEIRKTGTTKIVRTDQETKETMVDVTYNHEEFIPDEYDVEKVLENQEAYDLICPKCNTCITKRVILKRRKRKIPEVVDHFKVPSSDNNIAVGVTPPPPPPPSSIGHGIAGAPDHEQLPQDRVDVFRCFSCFSIFLPSGNSFKWIFIGDKKPEAKTPDQQTGETKLPADHVISIPTQGDNVDQETDQNTPETQPIQADVVAAVVPIEGTARPRVSGVSILKALVLGGLVELIASLSVVTSAAGADSDTLNILALGVANVIGGLFALAHKLRLLNHEPSAERYQEELGEREHFGLHATVAVVSYLIFGLMSPILYAFTFRSSNSRDYKLLVVGPVALVCIILLSLGKAHVRSTTSGVSDYIKTVSYYVGFGISACGVSFVVGDLLEMLFDMLGWSDSSSSLGNSMVWPRTSGGGRVMQGAWASF